MEDSDPVNAQIEFERSKSGWVRAERSKALNMERCTRSRQPVRGSRERLPELVSRTGKASTFLGASGLATLQLAVDIRKQIYFYVLDCVSRG